MMYKGHEKITKSVVILIRLKSGELSRQLCLPR